ncbi:MAG: rhomboid family intramembrane serine protease [Halanaeroarchaeum sp.]
MDVLSLGLRAGVALVVLGSALLVRWLDPGSRSWGRRLRSRLVAGVPWGTLIAGGVVILVYLVVQRGYANPYDPLYIPFSSWSYFYPLGVVLAPFSHQSLGHLTGNVLATVAIAPLAEYAFSHFPTRRGASAFGSWRTNPYVRAFLLFPAGVIGVGLLTSVFAWGPIIGFSGVVFAFAGFALVRYPISTVIALSVRDVVGTVYAVLRDPIVPGAAGPSFGAPWWAGIAIQGHLLGFLLGVALGTAVVTARRSEERPTVGRLWLGGVLVASNMTLWAVWWYRSGSAYVLYRGPGMLLVFALAMIVALTVSSATERRVAGVSARHIGLAVLLLPILTMGFVAVPLNATVVDDPVPPGESVRVRGYTVTYAEGVPNQRVGAIDLSILGETTTVNASGVIVINADRTIWTEAVSEGALAFAGERSVRVGGLGWSTSIDAIRRGWSVTGGGTAYQVALQPEDGPRTWVFQTSARTASPTIAGLNLSVEPVDGSFTVSVTRGNRTLATEPIPAMNESVRVGTLTVRRRGDRLIAIHGDTRVPFAARETYE